MEKVFEFGGFFVRQVDTPREVNFEVFDEEGYVCRLVPQLSGFDLSPLDLALENYKALPIVSQINEYIFHRDA